LVLTLQSSGPVAEFKCYAKENGMSLIETFISIDGYDAEKQKILEAFSKEKIGKALLNDLADYKKFNFEVLIGKDVPIQWQNETSIIIHSEYISPIDLINQLTHPLERSLRDLLRIYSSGEHLGEGYRYFKGLLCFKNVNDEEDIKLDEGWRRANVCRVEHGKKVECQKCSRKFRLDFEFSDVYRTHDGCHEKIVFEYA
jgi:hypothetical protein